LKSALSGRFISEDAALKDKKPNAVKAASERLKRLTDILTSLSPGDIIEVPGVEEGTRMATIVDVRLRNHDLPHQPGEWAIRYAVPGDTAVSEISIATLMREKGYKLHSSFQRSLNPDLSPFDRAPTGQVKEQKLFLDGNFVRSMLIATEISAGTMVSYKTESGQTHRSVLISSRGRKALEDRQSRIPNADAALGYLQANTSIFSEYRSRLDGLMIRADDHGYALSIPRGKDWTNFMASGPGDHVGTFKADRTGTLVARVADAKLKALIDSLYAKGLPLYFDNRTIAAKQNRFAGGSQQSAFQSSRPKF
jgi:hypothetical protein